MHNDALLKKRKAIFSTVQNFPYQINGLKTAEEVLHAGVGYCVSKHRLLQQLFREIDIASRLCYVPFCFGNVWLPVYLQDRGMAVKDWYHVFLACDLDGTSIVVDASFGTAFGDMYPSCTERDGITSMIPFGGPYEHIRVCTTKDQETQAKEFFTKKTVLDRADTERIEEFNQRSLSISALAK